MSEVSVLLDVNDIWKSYREGQRRLKVLKGIDLRIEAGDTVAVTGPSGAGKSTLLHILGGLDRPDEGTVHFKGNDIYRLGDVERAGLRNRSVGFIFQFYHLLPEFTALENVLLPGMIDSSRYSYRKLSDRAKKLMDQVGLAKRLGHKPNQMSGGELQRVAIARALMNDPDLILCDEPTGNLDSETGQQIVDMLWRLNRDEGKTILLVTHDLGIGEQAQRILHMSDGRIVRETNALKAHTKGQEKSQL